MTKNSSVLQTLSIILIKEIHQKSISPILNKKGTKCRFHPSCSQYTIIAINKYGFIKGWYKGIKRILRCKPNNYKSCIDYP